MEQRTSRAVGWHDEVMVEARQHISDDQRRARLAHRHRLSFERRTDDPVAITESLVALHSSDPATVYLSAMARMSQPAIEPLSMAMYEDRSLIRHHAMRRTVWVFAPDVARLAHAACTDEIGTREWKRLREWVANSDIAEPNAWLDAMTTDVLDSLRRLGPSSARQLGKAAPELTQKITIGSGKFTSQASIHTRVLQNLGFDATIVRTEPTGSWQSSEYTWRLMDDWLAGGIAGTDRTAGQVGLAERYLRSFGPVTLDDLQWWTGWTKGRSRIALGDLDATEVDLDDGSVGWVLPDDTDTSDPDDSGDVVLLPSLDPTAMGWKHRAWYLGEHATFGGPLFDRNGNVGPTIWVGGRVVGGWAQRRSGEIVHELLEPVDRAVTAAVAAEADRVGEAIGDAVVTPRFPTPLQKQLASG